MARKIRLKIGRQRLSKGVRPSEANYTRQIRKQMETIENNLTRVISGIEGLTPSALEYGVKPIFNKSQEYVPVKTRTLKDSGEVDTQITSKGAKVTISYGKGGKPPYAAFVHEIVEYQHASPTRAKFLEEAVNEHLGEVRTRVAEFLTLRAGLRGR